MPEGSTATLSMDMSAGWQLPHTLAKETTSRRQAQLSIICTTPACPTSIRASTTHGSVGQARQARAGPVSRSCQSTVAGSPVARTCEVGHPVSNPISYPSRMREYWHCASSQPQPVACTLTGRHIASLYLTATYSGPVVSGTVYTSLHQGSLTPSQGSPA